MTMKTRSATAATTTAQTTTSSSTAQRPSSSSSSSSRSPIARFLQQCDKQQQQSSSSSSSSSINQAVDEFLSFERVSLPERLETLCQRLDEIISNSNNHHSESRIRTTLSASIWASSCKSLEHEFAQLFASSLEENDEHDDDHDEHDTTTNWYTSLHRLQWLTTFLAPTFAKALTTKVETQVLETISGDFEQDSFLADELIPWKDELLVPWVVHCVVDVKQQEAWCHWLHQTLLQSFCQCRMKELFHVVADYPDSHPAIVELGPILQQTQLHAAFAKALETSLCQRLLHPGANTLQIIQVYMNTIKVLRHVDPSDRLLKQVAEPVRHYLRGRQDTVRCIITSLTDQQADLYQELRRQDVKPLDEQYDSTNANGGDNDDYYYEEQETDEPPTMDWMPPPPLSKQRAAFFDVSVMGATTTTTTTTTTSNYNNNSLDILSILVSIYGSKELFVDEYRNMLADKLLANLDYNTDQEVHTLELLKLRFGDASMRQCEIMIKDTDDSKRIVTNIQSKLKSSRSTTSTSTLNTTDTDNVVDAAIISHIFWPTISSTSSSTSSSSSFQHHERIQSELDAFSAEYGQLKNPRRLVWYNALGSVTLELEVMSDDNDNDEPSMKEITCSPLLATLISHFQDSSSWTVEGLAEKVGISEALVQRKMQFWIQQRVVVAVDNTTTNDIVYHVASAEWNNASINAANNNNSNADLEPSSSFTRDSKNAEQDELFTSYITGMLKRYKELPLHRIHDMLKLFLRGSEDVYYGKTPRQLSALLQKLCRQGLLEQCNHNMYKLVEE